ncbi:CDP-archaeol synthase [Labrys monachus]|uniref:CDP-2,3-bis-(O-geranylgeranyl)-sn-glycerol synthase n=1 Tax=Labrys monachus TaxID=217067 RepID=A0ABU0F829_9HYPH|nr:CDP-archaeol synthase [Labrys monachus]MDQ0390299.1 CDP-2,3-bis-(O-geranylgeranyl)-sn-glycerol synthase [Labrys monachus]
MNDWFLLLRLLVLLGVANSMPMFAKTLFGDRCAAPLDGGVILSDGRPLFGSSKTFRGLLVSLACTTLASAVLGLGWANGAIIAAGAMAGDLAASFIKRRHGVKVHGQAFGLDQIPEALVPLLLVGLRLGLCWTSVALLLALFVVLEVLLSRLLFRLGLREQPF